MTAEYYGYDAMDRLTRIVVTDGTSLSFAYNDAGLRTEKTVNGSTRRYVWNSGRLVADMGTADAFYFRYSSGGEMIGYTYYVGLNSILVHNSCRFNADQQAVLDLAKEYRAGISGSEAQTLWAWAQEYGISGHGPMSGHGIMWQGWHIKIKNIHIPIFPE